MLKIKNISLRYKVTGLIVLLLVLTVLALTELANYQMRTHFDQYLGMQRECGMMNENAGMHSGRRHYNAIGYGENENAFIYSMHNALYVVGGILIVVAASIGWFFTRRITQPLKDLARVARAMQKGQYGQKLPVNSVDEIGVLTEAFNAMSDNIQRNTENRRLMLANIAHEIKTPLTIIQGNIEGMVDGIVDCGKDNLLMLSKEIEHLNHLIKDLRDISLAEINQLALIKQVVNINQLLERIVENMRILAEERRVSLNFIADKEFVANVDGNRLTQIIHNLLSNALRHVPEETGVITIKLDDCEQQNKNWLQIKITDNGCGISADKIENIFDCFYRLDNARLRTEGGSGLGLAIVKQLCLAHGGDCNVTSEEDRGSTFTVRLPL